MVNAPKILIVTAAFGEGHNSAARNLAKALQAQGASVRVEDPCLLGAPTLTRSLAAGYRWVTTHGPGLWKWIYQASDRCHLGGSPGGFLGGPQRALVRLVEEEQPDVLVSTYPLYPYFLPVVERLIGRRLPMFTVVTDSIEIHSSWYRAEAEQWLVTDSHTQQILIGRGLAAERIAVTGFPVDPSFAGLPTVASHDRCEPFRILYFPTSKLPLVRRHSRALLDAAPQVELTLVLGKNVRLLHAKAREIKQAYPGRVRVLGWTRKVPQLMSRHHLVVGKAGGATVHEALAARCPMVIHHLVPGQEEGNLELLKRIGCGTLATTPTDLHAAVAAMVGEGGAAWRGMKEALERTASAAGATTAAARILSHLRS